MKANHLADPTAYVLDERGAVVPIDQLWDGRWIVLVLVRHFG